MNTNEIHGVRGAAVAAIGSALLMFMPAAHADRPDEGALLVGPNAAGLGGTYSASGRFDTRNAFFRSLGTNGRSCGTCHLATQSMSFTPVHARQLYARTNGRDPLFRSVDGANCPEVAARDRDGHSLILENGLIRVGMSLPATTEFTIAAVSDPHGCALRVDPQTSQLTASVYRRPLPSANLAFLSAVMWDTRETLAPLNAMATFDTNLRTDLAHQVVSAVLGHAEGTAPPSDADIASIVDFELALFTAQVADDHAGLLMRGGARGGPVALASEMYFPGINDPIGGNPTGMPFTAESMTLFTAWADARRGGDDRADRSARSTRADIAAGERLFNTLDIRIRNVRGLNDAAVLGKPAVIVGHCATCHDSPNVGNHSLPLPLDIGVSHSSDPALEPDVNIAAAVAQLSGANLPVFHVSGCANPFAAGEPASFYTTDPGRALLTGRCADFNRVKGPVLRGLAARAPYFHNGAAATLREALNFYDKRFEMGLTEVQKRQLIAFLNSL
jgi:cytochrome c peroxidase